MGTTATEIEHFLPITVEQEADRDEILRLHDEWWEANHGIDIPRMREVFPGSGRSYLMYNLNTHPYYGLEEKTKLWAYLQDKVDLTEIPERRHRRLEIVGDMAFLACEGSVPVRVIGAGGAGDALLPEQGDAILWRLRATEVYISDDSQGKPVWKMWHFHCSLLPPADEERPGFGDTAESRGEW
jgi:hypothetical protein